MDFYDLLLAKSLGGNGGGGGGITPAIKTALLACFSKVAWVDENGQNYYDTLQNALYTPADLSSITAVYSGGTVSTSTALNDLKADLTVTAHWSDESTSTVGADYYTLSGTLADGTNTITVTYLGKTTTFTVTATASGSDMNHWTDGVPYTNIEIVEGYYVNRANGEFLPYEGWNRTGYIPINGASTLSISPMSGEGGISNNSAFYTSNKTFISYFGIDHHVTNVVTVPATAYYFVLSEEAVALAQVLTDGVTPNA